MESELTCNHLIACASKLPSSLLKMHLLTQCVEMANFKFKLPPKIFGASVRCSNCCTAWSEGKYKLDIQRKLTVSAKKRYRKIIRNKNEDNTPAEVNKAIQNLHGKRFNTKCLVCNKTTTILQNLSQIPKKTEKPKKEKRKKNTIVKKPILIGDKNKKVNEEDIHAFKAKRKQDKKLEGTFYQTVNEVSVEPPKESNKNEIQNAIKRKKKRDKFAGLCKAACEASRRSLTEYSATLKNENPLNLFLKPA